MTEYKTATQCCGQSSHTSQTRRASTGANGAWQANGSAGRPEHSEGTIARTIERQTARLPSDLFLWAAGATLGGSVLLHCSGRKEAGAMVAQCAPILLLLGVYNKIVKMLGSDPRPSQQVDLS